MATECESFRHEFYTVYTYCSLFLPVWRPPWCLLSRLSVLALCKQEPLHFLTVALRQPPLSHAYPPERPARAAAA